MLRSVFAEAFIDQPHGMKCINCSLLVSVCQPGGISRPGIVSEHANEHKDESGQNNDNCGSGENAHGELVLPRWAPRRPQRPRRQCNAAPRLVMATSRASTLFL